MWQTGQAPSPSWTTAGCIGQRYFAAPGSLAAAGGTAPRGKKDKDATHDAQTTPSKITDR
jgi:hypothetical protein